MLGILIATTLNHALAASAGVWVARRLPPAALAWALAVGFIPFGIWTLRPDEPPETSAPARWGPLLTTVVVFFLAEMGDKTQLATVALGARFVSAAWVTAGSTLAHAGRRPGGRLGRGVSRPAGLAGDAAPHRGGAVPDPGRRGARGSAPAVVIRGSSTAIHKVSRIPSLPTSCG
jgi:hypothetical protein